MAAQPLLRSLSTRSAKVIEKPKPRKVSSSQNKVGLGPSLSLNITPEPLPRQNTYSCK